MKGNEDAFGYVLWGIGLLLTGIFVYLLAFRFNRTRLRVRNTAISKADSVAIGTVALQGTVQGDNLSVAPIAGKPSAYWQVEVSQYKRVKRENNAENDEWVVVRTDQFRPLDFHFDVADASGSRKVIGEGANMMLRWDEYNSTKPQPQLPPAGYDYLRHHNFEWKVGRRQLGSLRVRETRLEQGGQVYVLGTAGEVSDVKHAKTRPRGQLQNVFATIGGIERIVQAARARQADPNHAAAVSDSLQTAQLSQKLRETGNPALVELGNRIDAGGVSPIAVSQLSEFLEAMRGDDGYIAALPEVEVVVWRGTGAYPFIVANMTQADVVRNLRTRTWLDIGVGPALIIIGLLMILLNASAALAQYHRAVLIDAADKADVAGIRAAVRAGAEINERNEYGQTLLIQKIRASTPAGARALIAAGADPNVKDNYGDTALIFAVQGRNEALVGELIAAHARLNIIDKSHMTALLEAVRQNNPALVRELLDAGADANMRDSDGRTALINAAREGHVEITRLLIAARADPNLADKTGKAALQQAQEWNYPEVVRLLQAAGAAH